MTQFTLKGEATSALSHFALYGLAAICEDQLGAEARVWWTDERRPQPQLDVAPEQAIAEAVQQHAREHATTDSWVRQRIDHEERPTAALSPRIKAPSSSAAWRSLQSKRHSVIDGLVATHSVLDLRMIGALGEPAYWRVDRTPRPDEGASRWEMKARNRGEEFVGNRMEPLATAIAGRTVDMILSGLSGTTVCDEAGRNEPESRSATGFAPPGPVDNALAWCALWGISQFPVVHHTDKQSVTAATYVPGRRAHPMFVYLPAAVRKMTLPRLRSILVSSQLSIAASESFDDVLVEAARKWLENRGIRAVMRFPVFVSNNPSAPERWILNGSPIPMSARR
jgi:CRISPR-associated protein Csb3